MMPWSIRGGCADMSKQIVSMTADLSNIDALFASLRIRDFSPVTKKVESRFLRSARRRGWGTSGLKSRSGELFRAVTTFSGKRSAGIGIRTDKGKDLVLPKTIVHTYGKRKHSNPVHKKGRKSGRRSPWGDIPARPFIPTKLTPAAIRGTENLIMEFVDDRLK